MDPLKSIDLVLHPERDKEYVHFAHAATHPFMAQATTMSRCNAWWLADAALLAYWDAAEALRRFARVGMTAEALESGDTQCYLAWVTDHVFVCFRGTQSDQWQDIFDDAHFALVDWNGHSRVHRGFKAALARVWPMLEDRLKALAPSRSVWFCGHSLGAALATLAADRYEGTSAVCTIGSPRVGNVAFSRAFDARFGARALRYENDMDVVTHVPPPLPFGYEHTGALRHIRSDGTIATDRPSIASFFNDLIGNPLHVLSMIEVLRKNLISDAPEYLLDHMPRAYATYMWNDCAAHGN
jgi:triacylglycerol lipase